MASARGNSKAASNREKEGTTTRVKDRTHIHRVLAEVGLDPSDYIFSPVPAEGSSPASTPNRPSAFCCYPPQQNPNPTNQSLLKPQSQSLFSSSRPVSYVQQPPPLPPPLQPYSNPPPSQPSSNQSPPQTYPNQPPPPPPPSDTNQSPPQSFSNQAPPPNTNQPPSQSSKNQPPPSNTNQASLPFQLFSKQQQQQQNPPPQPRSSSPLNPPISNTQNRNSPSPYNMNQQSYSPRRSPPSPYGSNVNDSNLTVEHYLHKVNSHDTPPVKVVKPNTQNVVYRKEIRIRYLQPPTPPPPAPIIIREKRIPPNPPQSPLLIRERKPEARTPPPLTIRERPPTPPAPLEPYVIEKNLPPPPPQARQVIIERLPTPPPKPRTVVFEKWLPYKKLKRPVLLQKAPPQEPIKPTRNVIIEYEPLKAFTVRRVIEEGVFRVDPHQYANYNAQSHRGGDVRIVERIEDLPPPSEQLMRVLSEYNQPNQRASPLHMNSYNHQSHHSLSEHVPAGIQHLFSGGRPISSTDHLTNISRASSIPAQRQDRVLSTGHNSLVTSPTFIPLQQSRSKHSHHASHQYAHHHSSSRSETDDAY